MENALGGNQDFVKPVGFADLSGCILAFCAEFTVLGIKAKCFSDARHSTDGLLDCRFFLTRHI